MDPVGGRDGRSKLALVSNGEGHVLGRSVIREPPAPSEAISKACSRPRAQVEVDHLCATDPVQMQMARVVGDQLRANDEAAGDIEHIALAEID